ncbi:MAG: hypothetical protein ACOYXT_09730 [Bacteroidota bacterium]
MKYVGLFTLCLLTLLSQAQSSLTLAKKGKSLHDFVPKNWKILQTSTGDLNQDNTDDVVMVIQQKDPANIIINPGMALDSLDTNRRVLIILFKESANNNLRLAEISETFILNHYTATMDDPFDGLSISNGRLILSFHFWYSAGSWYQSNMDYEFQYRNNEFFLVKAEYGETHRATLEQTLRHFDFTAQIVDESKITMKITMANPWKKKKVKSEI